MLFRDPTHVAPVLPDKRHLRIALPAAKFAIVYAGFVTCGPLLAEGAGSAASRFMAHLPAVADRSVLAVTAALFLGAFVSGLAGFAFSAIAGSILLFWLDPVTVVPLLLMSSIATQLIGVATLWDTMRWRGSLPFVLGGLAGMPAGAALLLGLDARVFASLFGLFLVAYSTFMLVNADFRVRRPSRIADVFSGFAGGITGGAAAFPGAIPTIWCSMQGLAKDRQRGVVQPFILVMQIATLFYFSKAGLLSSDTAQMFLLCAPAIIAGTCLGVRSFKRVGDTTFRKLVLVFLMISGTALALR